VAALEAIKRLEMWLRGRNPRALRSLLRLARSLQKPLPSKNLDDDLIRECRFCSSRVAMLDLLPRDGRVAELGTYKGNFAREILARNMPKELHLIDIDYSQFDQTVSVDERVKCHHGLTSAKIGEFADCYFDWIYIDAGHSYADALADARASAPKVKPGGYLVFNDFAHIDPFLGRYGVHRAVVDFALEERWPVRLFAFSEYALYDVALQRPST
jgi:SAM-dependent methyltransferase